ncbi:MAG: nucleoside monophosphate kinase [bacterium]
MANKKFGFIAGPSGIGKGYGVGRVMKDAHDVRVFVTGDWCRENAESLANSGILVDDDVIFQAIVDDFNNSEGHYFIDAPRSIDQADRFISMFLEKDPEAEIHTIHIHGKKETCEDRLKDRATREGRNDDAEADVIERRLGNYYKDGGIHDTVIPVLKDRTKYHHINGDEDLELVRAMVGQEICPKIFLN